MRCITSAAVAALCAMSTCPWSVSIGILLSLCRWPRDKSLRINIQFNWLSCWIQREAGRWTSHVAKNHRGQTESIRGLTYLSCNHQPQTHEQKHMHTSSLNCPAQILDQGACLKNQRSNHKAITLATHQQRADSNTITFRLQQTSERREEAVLSSRCSCIIAPSRVYFKSCI